MVIYFENESEEVLRQEWLIAKVRELGLHRVDEARYSALSANLLIQNFARDLRLGSDFLQHFIFFFLQQSHAGGEKVSNLDGLFTLGVTQRQSLVLKQIDPCLRLL